ncbi:MAG: glycosyltransferase family 9 protein [Armatimonadetes bacterium]|nr:glycosyltransferase family 9 protein [Armatimonadota bacterium]
MTTERILLVKLDHIGDVLWATPVVSTLRKHRPQAFLAMAVSEYAMDVVKDNPFLDAVIPVPYAWHNDRGKVRMLSEKLKDFRFDQALVLDPVEWSNYLAFLSRAPKRIGYFYRDKPVTWLKALFHLTRRIPHPSQSPPFLHEVEVMLGLLRRIGIAGEYVEDVLLPIPKEDRAWAEAWLRGHDLSRPLAVHLNKEWFDFGWPRELFFRLLDEILAAWPREGILLTYGPWEEGLYARLSEEIARRPLIVSVGGLPLLRWAALLARCRALVSMDTGAVHMAAASGVPVVTIFEWEKELYRTYVRWVPWRAPYRCVFKQFNNLNQRFGDLYAASSRATE